MEKAPSNPKKGGQPSTRQKFIYLPWEKSQFNVRNELRAALYDCFNSNGLLLIELPTKTLNHHPRLGEDNHQQGPEGLREGLT